jgi:hypothetical protein
LWLEITGDTQDFMNDLLSIIHPGLHKSGLDALTKFRAQDSSHISHKWTSVYSGIQVISNRATPDHRDKSRPCWYDLLVSLGHGRTTDLILKELGLELAYGPGTVVGLCGTVFEHSVTSSGTGDRVCYAHFMRESVLERLGCPLADWVFARDYSHSSE